MKLQKLTYMSYGWWLAYFDEPFLNEQPQVWQHGPVFKSLYHALSTFGWRPIRTVQNDNFSTDAPRVGDDDHQIQNLVKWVWNRYGSQDATWLSEKTHERGTPWEVTVRQNGRQNDGGFLIPRDLDIPIELIKGHYRKLAVDYGFVED